jgi:chaperonin GroEL
MIYNNNKEEILKAVNYIAEPVLATYGPDGHNIIVRDPDKTFITKDGVSVAKSIHSHNPLHSVIIELVKEACLLTDKNANDGTTTSMLFTKIILEEGLKESTNGIGLKRTLDKDLEVILKAIDKKKYSNFKPYDVALTSSNGDKEISKLISKAFSIPNTSVIYRKDDKSDIITHEFIKGYSVTGEVFDNNYNYVNQLYKPAIHIVTGKITNFLKFSNKLSLMTRNVKNHVIFAEDFSEDVLKTIYSNRDSFNVICLRLTGISKGRESTTKNMMAYTDSPSQDPITWYETSNINQIQEFKVDQGVINFINSTEHKLFQERMTFLNNELNKSDGFAKQSIQDVISKFNSGISIINIGTSSDIEYRNIHDKIEDAIGAVKSANKEGVVLGGGMTAYELSMELKNIHPILRKVLKSTYEYLDHGLTSIQLEDQGIYDATLVLKQSLINSIAVAGTILTTNTIIVNE